MGDLETRKLHAIVFPIPYQGHINPTTSLALQLASMGVTVTFVHTEYVHYKLSKAHSINGGENEIDLFSEARKSGLDIRIRIISDGFPLEFDRNSVSNFDEFSKSFIYNLPPSVDEILQLLLMESSVQSLVPFLVADTVFSWLSVVSEKYNLPTVSFWTQPALVFSILYHSDLLAENGHYPCKDNIEEEITYIPGVHSLNTKDLMPYMKESEVVPEPSNILSKAFEEVKKVDFVLCNTVEELEPETLSALNKKQPYYAIGPVNLITNPICPTISRSLWTESDCSKWLESKEPNSVLYISFGSLVQTTKQDIQEIAYGLLLSQVNFIWVARANIEISGEVDVFPEGFEDQSRDKGLIIPWCDQITVLSHSSVGAFLTHCGWNSITESMSLGVPMICYPLQYDQLTNRKLVVDDWKIGVNLSDSSSVNREEVAEKISKLIGEESSVTFRQESEKIKLLLQNALENDGCSDREYKRFIKDLKDKISSAEFNERPDKAT